MRCDKVMKRNVQTVAPRDDVELAAIRMRDENVGFLPVCDHEGRVLGAITDRDIAIRLVASGRPASSPVEDVMSSQIVACDPADDIKIAEELMARFHKSRIMIVDRKGVLRGVISLSDIAQHETRGAAKVLQQITEREARE